MFDLPTYVRYCLTDEELQAFYEGVDSEITMFRRDHLEKDPKFSIKVEAMKISEAFPGLE